MTSEHFLREYLSVQGPDSLYVMLKRLSRSQGSQYILYQLDGQKSLIKVDTSREPFEFWYCDLLDRPATKGVKKAIARWLGGSFEQHFHDLYQKRKEWVLRTVQTPIRPQEKPGEMALLKAWEKIEKMQAQLTDRRSSPRLTSMGHVRRLLVRAKKLMFFGVDKPHTCIPQSGKVSVERRKGGHKGVT